METENLAEKYIDQTASEQELQKIQQKMESDTTFREEVLQLQAIRTILKAEAKANLYADLDTMFEETVELSSTKNGVRSDKSFRKFVLWAAACISLMIVALISFQHLNSSPLELYVEYYKPFKVSNLRSEVKESIYWSGVELYQQGDFQNALSIFEKSIVEEPNKLSEIHLLIGICQLELQQTEKAISEFEKIKPSDKYHQDAEWYLALANLKNENKANAQHKLEKISESNGLYAQKAKKLLENM